MADFASTAATLAATSTTAQAPKAPKDDSAARKAALAAKPRLSGTAEQRITNAASLKAATTAAKHERSPEAPVSNSNDKAFLAATKSFSQRPRPTPAPVSPSVNRQQTQSTLRVKARTEEAKHRNQTQPVVRMPREMFTEHPPVSIEVEEKRHKEALHASAVTLARQMYSKSQVSQTQSGLKRSKSTGRLPPSLQEIAQQHAAERLAKINHPDETKAFREYYGYSPKKENRLLVKVRRRGKSVGDDSGAVLDLKKTAEIQAQMSRLAADISQVDQDRRERDRQRLIVISEEKVRKIIHDMDEKLFNETGRMSDALLEKYDEKARERIAQQRRSGYYSEGAESRTWKMDDEELEKIARERVRPVLAGMDDAVKRKEEEDEDALMWEKEEKDRHTQERRQKWGERKNKAKDLFGTHKAKDIADKTKSLLHRRPSKHKSHPDIQTSPSFERVATISAPASIMEQARADEHSIASYAATSSTVNHRHSKFVEEL